MRGVSWRCGLAVGLVMLAGARVSMAQGAVGAGQPAAAATAASASDQEIEKAFLPLLDQCAKAVNERSEAAQQVSDCKAAAGVADRFAPNTRMTGRRAAYVYYATALMRNQQIKDAVAYGDKAVKVVLEGQDDNTGSAAAYGIRAQAQALRGFFAEADKDLVMAENYQRAAVSSASGEIAKNSNLEALRTLLNLHAKVLIALGRTSEGRAKSMEAATL